MNAIGKKCECPCHSDSGMRHIQSCCFKCPCCGEKIDYEKKCGHEERIDFIKQHLAYCASSHGEPRSLDRYLKQIGIKEK